MAACKAVTRYDCLDAETFTEDKRVETGDVEDKEEVKREQIKIFFLSFRAPVCLVPRPE